MQVHDPPVRIDRSRGWIERHLAQRMRSQRILHAQELPGGAFERGVRNVAILPLDQHDLAIDLPVDGRRRHGRRRRVSGQIESWHDAAPWHRRPGCRRVFHVQRVEHAVPGIVRIENDVGEASREVPRVRELREQARSAGETVEVEILGERFRLLVEDVERPVEVVDEETPSARFIPQVVDSSQLRPRVRVGVVGRDRQRRIVLEFQHQLRC